MSQPFGSPSVPTSFHTYHPRSGGGGGGGDYDIESGAASLRRPRKTKPSPIAMFTSIANHVRCLYKLHPLALLLILSLSFALALLLILTISTPPPPPPLDLSSSYPLPNLRNLVMVAGHSVYTSTSCGRLDREDSWLLESYQKHPGQAATFLAHIKEGVEIAADDEAALLLFSGGETRKNAGPRSEAQSYWAVSESKGWFGRQEVRDRALTEEHARDSFENLLFSVCRFRELTGTYPENITVVSYDFKEERFANLHRSAIGFPEDRFFYLGTPASPASKEAAMKGEASVRMQFLEDPYGCLSSLHRKRLKRDPFHRSIPYPNGCPEVRELFRYCGPVPYPGTLPWNQ